MRNLPKLSRIQVPYGNTEQSYTCANELEFDLVLPNNSLPINDPKIYIQNQLQSPLDKMNLDGCLAGKKVGICVNDTTRPVPNPVLLPPLLEFLTQKGIAKKDISFFIAYGTHQQKIGDEKQIFPPSILSSYPIHHHNCDDKNNLIYLGETSRKTPIIINKEYHSQDIKIVVGNIEPHHFMGYSGGVKSAAIGLGGRETIRINHSHLIEAGSFIGNYETNPTRMDLEEIGDRIGISSALNVVLNSEKQIVKVLWGTPHSVMEMGIPVSKKVCQKKVDKLYDLVIASPGGFPKDINLYQAQKAITHVSQITKEQGIILLVAECREGLGSVEFEKYLGKFASLEDVSRHFSNEKFEIGPHKAYLLARQASRNRIIIVSSIPSTILQKTHLEFASSLSEAMDLIFASLPPKPALAVVPYATNTMFY